MSERSWSLGWPFLFCKGAPVQWGNLKSNGLIHWSVGPYSVLESYPIVSAHCAFASRPHYHYWLCSKNSAIAMVGEAPSERSKQTTDVRVQHGRQNGLKPILKEYSYSHLWTLKSSSFYALMWPINMNPFCCTDYLYRISANTFRPWIVSSLE